MDKINALVAQIHRTDGAQEKLKLYIRAAQECLAAAKQSKNSGEQARLKSTAAQLITQAEALKTTTSPQAWKLKSLDAALPSGRHTALQHSANPHGPVQSRTLPVTEQKILWLSSRVNGHKFPPWTRTPDASDFALPDDDSLFSEGYDLSLSRHQIENFDCWARPAQAVPPPTWFDNRDEMAPSMSSGKRIDLVQDTANDCSVVASLCADMSRAEKGFASILASTMFPSNSGTREPAISPNGRYLFRFNFNGCLRAVEIDDRLPLSKSKRILHIVDRNNPQLLWPALVEKAYLKVRGGYDFPGSNSNTDLWILAGWIPEIIFLEQSNPATLWSRVAAAFERGDVLITVGTGKMSQAAEQELGLVGQHNYAILDIKEQDGREMVLIKNPWCEATLWSTAQPTKNNVVDENPPMTRPRLQQRPLSRLPPTGDDLAPGTFWMFLTDVYQNFESLYLNWNPNIFSHRQDMHFTWDLTTAHRASNSLTQNPQFSLKCAQGGTTWLLLCRHFREDSKVKSSNDSVLASHDRFEDPGQDTSGYISLFVFENNGKRVYDEIGAVKQGPFVDSMQTLLRLQLPPNTTYTVAIAEQYLAKDSHSFTLTAYSESPIVLTQVAEKYACTTMLQSAWNSFNSGGSTNSPAFAVNPQFKLEITRPTPIAILLETCGADLNINVKLCYSGGKRIYTIKRQDVILDSNEYRKGSSFVQTKDVVLEPGQYTIIASTFEAGQTGTFGLRIDSDSPVRVLQLPSEHHGKLSVILPKAVFGEDTSKVAIRLVPLRLATLTVVVKYASSYSKVATSVRGTEDNRTTERPRIRSPLRLSLQLGRGPDSRELASSFGGQFSDATIAGLRIFDVPVYKELTRDDRLYLVIERMGKGVPGSEEKYHAEILMANVDSTAIEAGGWEVFEEY